MLRRLHARTLVRLETEVHEDLLVIVMVRRPED